MKILEIPISIRTPAIISRFLKFVGPPEGERGCWRWKGSIQKGQGYGTFGVRLPEKYCTTVKAHRISYVLFIGPIPEGLELDHTCRNRWCVNPNHVEPVTHVENCDRGVSFCAENARKTQCPKGHPLSGDNLRFDKRPNGKIARRCNLCANAAVSRNWANKPEAWKKARNKKKAAYNKIRIEMIKKGKWK